MKSVRREAEDVPVLVGRGDRRILGDETYDRAGNLLKDYWFQDSGEPTSVTIYGFVDGARVSDSEEVDYDTTMKISGIGIGSGDEDVKLQEPTLVLRIDMLTGSINQKDCSREKYTTTGAS